MFQTNRLVAFLEGTNSIRSVKFVPNTTAAHWTILLQTKEIFVGSLSSVLLKETLAFLYLVLQLTPQNDSVSYVPDDDTSTDFE